MANPEEEDASERVWYRRPMALGMTVLAITAALNFAFI